MFERPLLPAGLARAYTTYPRLVLAWEPLPASVPPALFKGDAPRASGLVYDVRIHEAVRRGDLLLAGPLVLERTNLATPLVEITEKLTACTDYFWTVRARFMLDGRPRATEWMGAYSGISPNDPRPPRRGSTIRWPSWMLYPPLRTGPIDQCR